MSRKDPEKPDFAPMAEAHELCNLLFLWLKKRKQCKEKLSALAKELEDVHEISAVSQVVGSVTSVVAVSTAGIVTLLTGGLATPLLVATTVGTIAGAAVDIGSTAIEAIMSGSTMKEAKNTIREDEKIGKDFQEAVKNLKKKCGAQQNGAHGPTDVGCEVATQIMGALARQNNIDVPLYSIRSFVRSTFYQNLGGSHAADAVSKQLTFAAVTFLCFQLGIECFKKGLESSAKGLGKSVASSGAKLLGVIGLGISVYSLFLSCEEMLKSNQGTKASRALKTAAREIQEARRSLEEQLDAMKKILKGLEQEQQKRKEIEQEQQKRKEIEQEQQKRKEIEQEQQKRKKIEQEQQKRKEIEQEQQKRKEIEQEQQKRKEIEQEQQKRKEIEQEQQKRKEIEQEQQKRKEIEQEQQKRKEIDQEQQKRKEIEQEQQKRKEIEQEQQKRKEIEQEQQKRKKIEQEQQKRKKSYLLLLYLFLLCPFLLHLFKQKEQEESSEEAPAVNVGLLNVHSILNMRGKRIEIKNLITEHNLDVFLMTETWLKKETADEALSEASPPNFQFHHECRDTDTRGGGVSIQFSQKLHCRRIGLNSITIFEYVAATLRHEKWDEDVVFINVYNPPTNPPPFEEFLEEFTKLLKKASKHNRAIVAGDFNFNVKNNNNSKKPSEDQIEKFKKAFETCGFKQHVKKPTHKSGSTLDLVFSRNVEVFIVKINRDLYKDLNNYISDHDTKKQQKNLNISDHSTIYFKIRLLPSQKMQQTKANPFKKEE